VGKKEEMEDEDGRYRKVGMAISKFRFYSNEITSQNSIPVHCPFSYLLYLLFYLPPLSYQRLFLSEVVVVRDLSSLLLA